MSDGLHGDVLRRQIAHRYRQRGGFKTVDLNVVGWGALIGVGLAAGTILAFATGVPAQVALPVGLVGAWALLLALDHYRWRNGMVHLSHGGIDRATTETIVARLQEMGITATYRETIDEDQAEPHTQDAIVCRQADAEPVRRVLTAEREASI